jgi:transcriptional regulator with XRE-family HTH domain
LPSARRPKLLRGVGRRVVELRTERGLTQEELAARLRMSDRYLRRIEAGEINLTVTSLAKLAGALGVPTAALLEQA